MKTTLAVAALVCGTIVIIVTLIGLSNKQAVEHPSIVVIDGCQYLSWDSYMGYRGYTHRGNCTNAIHW